MTIEEIMKILPHRYPFLMVDRIIELVPGERATGVKNITVNEPFFPGHFPDRPVMPGVLMIECMAQVGACAMLSLEKFKDRLAVMAGVDQMRFKRQAVPGDVLLISTDIIRVMGNIGKGRGKITIDGELVCSGEFLFAIEPAGR